MRKTRTAVILALFTTGCTGSFGGESVGAGEEEVLQCLDCPEGEQYCNCMLEDMGDDDYRDLLRGGCWITGGGHIGSAESTGGAGQHDQDSFGFNAMGMKDGRVRGELQDTTHLGDVFHGHATWITCWKDDGIGPEVPRAEPNNAVWGGHGSWNHADGYRWMAHLADRAEGGSHQDEYELWVWAPDGNLVYSQTADMDLVITGGNFQIHPPNRGHPYITGEVPPEAGAVIPPEVAGL
jgi:hypothetical protein